MPDLPHILIAKPTRALLPWTPSNQKNRGLGTPYAKLLVVAGVVGMGVRVTIGGVSALNELPTRQ